MFYEAILFAFWKNVLSFRNLYLKRSLSLIILVLTIKRRQREARQELGPERGSLAKSNVEELQCLGWTNESEWDRGWPSCSVRSVSSRYSNGPQGRQNRAREYSKIRYLTFSRRKRGEYFCYAWKYYVWSARTNHKLIMRK